MVELVTGRGSRHREPRRGTSTSILLCVLLALWGCDQRSTSAPITPAKEDTDAAKALNALINKARAARDGSDSNSAHSPSVLAPTFVDVADEIGVHHHYYSDTQPGRYFLPEIMGGGAGWLDFDLDGWLDVYYANGCPLTSEAPENPADYFGKLLRNRGGTFSDITIPATAGECRYGQGVAIGDFDADGFPDVFLANYGPDVLLHNQGDGTFMQVTEPAGMIDNLWGASGAWFDADNDGDLDLYVVNYLDVTFKNSRICEYLGNKAKGFCGPGEYPAVPDFLYVNQGDGTFVQSLDAYGMTAEQGKGLAIAVLDFDGDLMPEIYVANDMTPNFLFALSASAAVEKLQRATGKMYVEIGGTAGCAVSGAGLNEASMGVACADYDGDAQMDIYLTHFFNNKNTLYRNLGNLTFTDDSYRTRVGATSMAFNGFGCAPIDYDRDGWMDLIITNGHVLGPEFEPNVMRPQFLRNDGRAMFSDISDLAGPFFESRMLGRGLATADYDNDGDVDVTISHLDRPVAVLRNDTKTARHYLGLELRTRNRIPPIGGRVVVNRTSGSQTIPIQAGGSYESTSDSRIVAGLVDDRGPVSIEVHWPSGQVDQWKELEPNKYYVMYEGTEPRQNFWPAIAATAATQELP